MPKRGIIDLGSNTIRLVVYEVKSKASKPFKSSDFRTLINEKRVAGLSSYVVDDRLTEAGVEKAVDVLNRHLGMAKNVGCNDVSIFATAVIRNRVNCRQVVREIEQQVGHEVRVLSGQEESHLGFVGASLTADIERGLLIDIGGGSTELTFAKKGCDYLNVSIDQGCVSSYSEFVGLILPKKRERVAIRKAFEQRLSDERALRGQKPEHLYAIGGSVRAIAKLRARMLGSDKSPKRLSLQDIDAIFDLADSDLSEFAHMAAKAVPDRIHTVLPGCVILRAVMKRFELEELSICKYGVREGYLIEEVL